MVGEEPSSGAPAALRMVWTQPLGPSTRDAAPVEDIFQALDGTTVCVLHQSWQVTVYSICEEDGQRWIQIGLRGNEQAEDHRTLTLCIRATENARHAIRILSSWLANPLETGRILNVA